MIVIDNILVDKSIIDVPFLCDTKACKGSCCTFPGGSGAPLAESEIQDLLQSSGIAQEYLTESSRQYISEHGAYYQLEDGDYAVTCIEEKDCVFVYYEDEIAKCALEKAYHDGKTSFRKPLSCHLYPIRVADFGGPYLYYDVFEGCRPALSHGKITNVRVFEMLKEPLIRAFGENWYRNLLSYALQQTDDD